jgi:hypothetical protein
MTLVTNASVPGHSSECVKNDYNDRMARFAGKKPVDDNIVRTLRVK